jgi:hypothetical protein
MTIDLERSGWTGVLMGDQDQPLMKCKSGDYPICSE